MLWPGQENTI